MAWREAAQSPGFGSLGDTSCGLASVAADCEKSQRCPETKMIFVAIDTQPQTCTTEPEWAFARLLCEEFWPVWKYLTSLQYLVQIQGGLPALEVSNCSPPATQSESMSKIKDLKKLLDRRYLPAREQCWCHDGVKWHKRMAIKRQDEMHLPWPWINQPRPHREHDEVLSRHGYLAALGQLWWINMI